MSPPDDIMDATWCALCRRGYADLTMQAIADETDKSKAALHYHYDSKQELLESFLDHAADRFLERLHKAAAEAETPAAQLSAVVDAAFSPPVGDDRESVSAALLELRAQAPHQPAFRERLCEADDAFCDLLAAVLAAGVESGAFRADLDPQRAARTIVTFFDGSRLRQVSLDEDPEMARTLLESYLDSAVYAEGQR